MNGFSWLMLACSTAIFIGAGSSAKAWAISQASLWLVLTLLLYTAGNLIMLRLIKDVGMAVALSLSAIVQLIAVNAVALLIFGERISGAQGIGIALAVVSIALITLTR